jgi:hypothetical protein
MKIEFYLFLWKTRLVREFCRSQMHLFGNNVRGHERYCRDCDVYEGMWW